MEHGVGKYRRKTIRKNKPYNRPPKRSVFTRVTDTFKSFISPFTLGWITNKNDNAAQELESSVDEETSAGCSYPIDVHTEATTASIKDNVNGKLKKSSSASSAIAIDAEVTVEKNVGASETSKRGATSSALPQLWRNKVDSRPQVSASDAHEPRFNPTSYVGTLREKNRRLEATSPASLNMSRLSRDSSFYNGPTQFGGALNTSMNNYAHTTSLNTSLNASARYSIPRVQQVKVLPNKRRKISFVSNNNTPSSQQQQQHTTSSRHRYGGTGNLSSTAEKILKAMEKLNTPVSDIRRIPVSERKGTPYAVTRSRRRRTEGLLEHSITNKRKPPVSNGMTSSTPARFSQQKQIPLDNSLVSSKIRFGKSPATKPTADDVISPFKSPQTPFNAAEPAVKIGSSSGGRGGGKMKNKRRTHVSAVASNDDGDNQYESHLPLGGSVAALPLGGDMKLPSFGKFGNPASSSTPAVTLKTSTNKPQSSNDDVIKSTPKTEKKLVPSTSINFSFSSPKALEKANVAEEVTKTSHLPNFSFSKPVPTCTDAKLSVDSSFDKKAAASVTTPQAEKSSSSSNIFTSPTTLLKKGSVMDILGGGKPSAAPTVMKKWECETCMIRNDDDVMKCVACTAAKPGTTPVVDKPSGFKFGDSGSKPTKRVSFGLPKSMEEVSGNQGKKGANSSSEAAAAPSSGKAAAAGAKWSCPTCMVGNKADDLKCVCCAEPKPGSKPAATEKKSAAPTFSFGAPSTVSSSSGGTSSMFKAPSMKLPSSSTTSSGGVKFGFSSPAPTSTSSAASNNDVTSSSATTTIKLTKKSEDRWECPICMIRNDASKTKCAACEAPNPNASSGSTSASSGATGGFKYGPTSASLIKFGAPPPSKPSADTTSSSSAADSKPSFGLSAAKPSFGLSAAKPSFGFGSNISSSSGENSATTTSTTAGGSGFSFSAPNEIQLSKVDSSKIEEKSSSAAMGAAPGAISSTSEATPPPSYQFGIKSAVAAPPSDQNSSAKTAGFSFGAPASATPSSDKKTPSLSFNKPAVPGGSTGFGFGKQVEATGEATRLPTATTPASTSGFSGFGTAAAAKTPATTPASTSGFSGFGTAAAAKTPATTPAPSLSMFGSKSTASSGASDKPASSFSFGNTPSSAAPSGVGNFNFTGSGDKPTTNPTTPSTSFKFGSTASSSDKPVATSTTSFNQSAAAAATGSFNFGATTKPEVGVEKAAGPAATFAFGAKPGDSKPAFQFNQQQQQPSTTPMFGSGGNTPSTAAASSVTSGLFGAKQATPSGEPKKNLFGSSTASSAPSMFSATPSSTMFGAGKPAASNTSSFAPNTSFASKNTGLFGAQQQEKAADSGSAKSIFGGTDKSASTSIFGTKDTAPTGIFGAKDTASTGIFGANKPTTTSTTPNTTMFGATMSNSATSGGMFGNQQSAPTMFGTKSSTSSPFNFSGGGNTSQQQSSTASSGGGMFGGAASQAPSSGGFNFSGDNKQQASSGFGFVKPNNPQQQQVFPSSVTSSPATTSSSFGGGASSMVAPPGGGGFGAAATLSSAPAAVFKFGGPPNQSSTSATATGASGFNFNQSATAPASNAFQFGVQNKPAAPPSGGFTGFGTQQSSSGGGATPSVDNSMFSIGMTNEAAGMKRSSASRPVRKAQRRLRK